MRHHHTNNDQHEKCQHSLLRIFVNLAWWDSFLLLVQGDIVVEIAELELLCPLVTFLDSCLVNCPKVLDNLFLAFP